MIDNFCTDCTWWPIYPRTCEHKLVDCIASYTNDNIACGTDYYAYEAMQSEGHDARMLSFSPNAPSAPGGHQNPKNKYSWIVGCLGIVDSCSSACETSFLQCIQSTSVDEFARCEGELENGNIANCSAGCAPTLEMLKTSETPVVINLSQGKFGTQTGLSITTNPEEPPCQRPFGSFDDVGNDLRCQPPSGQGPAEGEILKCSNDRCSDTPLKIKITTNSGKVIKKLCAWVAKKNTGRRCALEGVSAACPKTCGTCDNCKNSSLKFRVEINASKWRWKDCAWAASKPFRCKNIDGVSEVCRSSCGLCS